MPNSRQRWKRYQKKLLEHKNPKLELPQESKADKKTAVDKKVVGDKIADVVMSELSELNVAELPTKNWLPFEWPLSQDHSIRTLDLRFYLRISSRNLEAIFQMKNLRQVVFRQGFSGWWGLGTDGCVPSTRDDIKPFAEYKEYDASRVDCSFNTPSDEMLHKHFAYCEDIVRTLMRRYDFEVGGFGNKGCDAETYNEANAYDEYQPFIPFIFCKKSSD